jgi:hypothetical protein
MEALNQTTVGRLTPAAFIRHWRLWGLTKLARRPVFICIANREKDFGESGWITSVETQKINRSVK